MTISLILYFIFCFILIVVLGVWIGSQPIGLIRAGGVPYVPLRKKQLESIVSHIRLKVTDNFVDLGSGDGRVLRIFEKQGVKNLSGYEVNYWAYLSSLVKNKFYHSKAKIYFKNFKKINLSEYNVVFCYLLEEYLRTLKEKFDKELKPGTKIISYGFEIKNWRPAKIIYTNKEKKNLGRIFIYTI